MPQHHRRVLAPKAPYHSFTPSYLSPDLAALKCPLRATAACMSLTSTALAGGLRSAQQPAPSLAHVACADSFHLLTRYFAHSGSDFSG